MTRAALVAVLAVVACGGERQPARTPDTTAVAAADTACGLLQAVANPDPLELVREYVRRDGAGELLARHPWLDTAYSCPARVPGPDGVTIVAGQAVRAIAQDAERARVLVTSTLVGDLVPRDSSLVLERRVGTQRDTFIVLKTTYGWRINARQLPRLVTVAPALARFADRLPEADMRFLLGIAARRQQN